MESCVLDALDKRHVITCDIPGAFLQGLWLQDEHHGYIKFEGVIVDILCEINPEYKKKVIRTKDGKRKFLFPKLVKVLYGKLLDGWKSSSKRTKHINVCC